VLLCSHVGSNRRRLPQSSARSALFNLLIPHDSLAVLGLFPGKYVLYNVLPKFPCLHSVATRSSQLHSVVLNCSHGQSGFWFSSPARTSCQRVPPPPSTPTAGPVDSGSHGGRQQQQQAQAAPRDFSGDIKAAEQRWVLKVHESRLNRFMVMCASLGFDTVKY
jgi:hypothetical protein